MSTLPITDTPPQADTQVASLIERCNQLLEQYSTLTTSYVDTLEQLRNHTIDPETHFDIRAKIQAIVTGTNFISLEYFDKQVPALIGAHDTSTTCHQDIRLKQTAMENKQIELEGRVKALEPIIDPDDPVTELEKKLAEIDAYYNPTLEKLMAAYNAAALVNDKTAMNNIAIEYQRVLTEKANKRAEAMLQYQP